MFTIRHHAMLKALLVLGLLSAMLSLRWLSVFPLLAQAECGFAESINYPVDTTTFTLAQDYGAPSPRHQGRYHTGEDWYGGRGFSLGQPIRAAAAGRVTYSYPLGWGRDGGVVIIEHTFRDGSVLYTQYGHITESTTVTFPPRLSCVEAGQVIGVIADARPAPHLHFEVRVTNGDVPGPGYNWESLDENGWRDPMKAITNRQAWLKPSHTFHLLTTDPGGLQSPPLLLNDNSLLYLDGDTLKRATADGRVMWRITLERQAVSLIAYEGQSLLVYGDGTVQVIDIDGVLGDSWQTGESFAGPPIRVGAWLLYPTTSGGLAALGPDRREIVWQMDNVPDFVRWHVAGDENNFIIGLITPTGEILILSHTGQVMDRALLRETGSFTTTSEGDLLIYTRGGLWRIEPNGQWSLVFENAPPGGESSAITLDEAGRLYLFDGDRLYAYDPAYTLLWETDIPDEYGGLVELEQHGTFFVLSSTHGQITTVNDGGLVCNRIRIYGEDGGIQWHTLGSDGVLRVAIGDQILGLGWEQFTRACR